MWRRKNKNPAEQGSNPGRQVQRSGGVNPAFSYYTTGRVTDRGAEPVRERPDRTDRFADAAGRTDQPAPARRGRFRLSQAPFWLLVILAGVCLVKVLALSTSPKIVVVGKTSLTAAYLQPTGVYAAAAHKLLAGSITSRSKLTVNLDGTARQLERQFPELQAVSLGLPLVGSRPIVYVQVAQPSLIVQTAHGNYALNKAGVVLAKLQTIPAQVPIAVDQSGATPRPGKQFLPSSTVSFVQTVAYQLSAAHQTISTFVLPADSPYELDVHLDGEAYYVRFNLAGDALTQSGAAVATIQQLGAAGPGSYLDVRVPGRVYYK